MAQGLSLEQKILQRLSPLQMQMIQMLHLPQKELEDYVRKALEENPVLEELPPRQDGGFGAYFLPPSCVFVGFCYNRIIF